MRFDRPALGCGAMRLVLRHFVTSREDRIEVVLWSRSRELPALRSDIRRCVRLYAHARAQERERKAAAAGE
jgi:hypothetical protein